MPSSRRAEMRPWDSVRYVRYRGLEGLEVMDARWLEHSFNPHMHDFYAVSLNRGGHGAFECRKRLRDAAPGTCNLIGPGEVHTGRATSSDGWSYCNLHIEAHLMAALLQDLDWRGAPEIRFKAPLVHDEVLAGLVARLHSSLRGSISLLHSESMLLSVMARLTSHHALHGRVLREAGWEHAAVRRVRDWLDANSERNVSIRALADLAELSPWYLVRVFRRHVGIPPHRYHLVVRVNRARTLVASGVSIAAVAYRTGFCDQSHLNRCFKQVLGTTPGRYASAASSPHP